MKTTTLKLGNHRGNLRLWIEGKALAAHGFTPGSTFLAAFTKARLVLLRCHPNCGAATRTVSKRAEDSSIIDICCAEMRESFGKASHVKVKFDISTDGAALLIITPANETRQHH